MSNVAGSIRPTRPPVSSTNQGSPFELILIPGPRAVQRIFELTGMLDALPFAGADETRQPVSKGDRRGI